MTTKPKPNNELGGNMNKFYIYAIKIEEFDNDIHICGPGFSGANTLCGVTDAGQPEDSEEVPNCVDCIEVYESVKSHRPRFNFKR